MSDLERRGDFEPDAGNRPGAAGMPSDNATGSERAATDAQSSVAGEPLNDHKPLKKAPKTSDGKKRRAPQRKYADVEGKPKQPKSAYIYFLKEAQAEFKGKSTEPGVSGHLKAISEKWAALDPVEKKKYEELAEKDRARYRVEMKEFEEEYAKRPAAAKRDAHPKAKLKKIKVEKNGTEEQKQVKLKAVKAGNPSFTFRSDAGETRRVPVFSEEFMEQNRQSDTQLRNLRRSTNTLEEEIASLERQIEQWTREAEKLDADTREKNAEVDACEVYDRAVKDKLMTDFSSLSIPGRNGGQIKPNHENMNEYCEQLGKLFKGGQCPPAYLSYREFFRRVNWPT